MKQLIRIILLSLIYSSSFSQTQLRKGFVVLNNDERVDGFIFLRAANRNPTKINFNRDSSLKQMVAYNVSDLKSFEVINVDRYVRADVLTDVRPFDAVKEVPAKLDTFRAETVWLRELASGQHVSLYELYDTRRHYFIADSSGEFKELMYKKGRENDRPYNFKSYIIQLQQYLEKSNPQSTASFTNTKYAQYDFVKAVDMINGDSTTKNATLERDLKTHYSIFVGAGVGTVKAKLSGFSERTGDLDFKNDIFPLGVIGMDFSLGRKPGLMTFRADVTYNSIDLNATGTHPLYGDITYELQQTDIVPAVSVLFNLVNRRNLKFYIAPSFSYHLSSYKGNVYISYYPSENRFDDYMPLRKVWGSIDARAGVKINKGLEIGLKGELSGNFQADPRLTFLARRYTAMLAYHFIQK